MWTRGWDQSMAIQGDDTIMMRVMKHAGHSQQGQTDSAPKTAEWQHYDVTRSRYLYPTTLTLFDSTFCSLSRAYSRRSSGSPIWCYPELSSYALPCLIKQTYLRGTIPIIPKSPIQWLQVPTQMADQWFMSMRAAVNCTHERNPFELCYSEIGLWYICTYQDTKAGPGRKKCYQK